MSSKPVRLSPQRPPAVALSQLITATEHLHMLSPEHDEDVREDYQSRWRAAYFEAMRLMRPGDALSIEGHTFTRTKDRLTVEPIRNDDRRAS